jgi:uncharacterized protein
MQRFEYSVFVLAFGFCISIAQAATIVVVGQGVVSSVPDVASVTLTVRNKSVDAVKARSENENVNKAVIAGLLEIGVKREDIARSMSGWGQGTIKSGNGKEFEVFNAINVKASDFEILPQISTVALDNGVSSVSEPQYSLSDNMSAMNEARVKAYHKAKEEAEKSAQTMQLKLGPVVKVSVGAAALVNLFAGADLLAANMASETNLSAEPSAQIEMVKTQYFVTIEYEILK